MKSKIKSRDEIIGELNASPIFYLLYSYATAKRKSIIDIGILDECKSSIIDALLRLLRYYGDESYRDEIITDDFVWSLNEVASVYINDVIFICKKIGVHWSELDIIQTATDELEDELDYD